MTGLSKIALIVGGHDGLRRQLAHWLAVFEIDSVQVAGTQDAVVAARSLKPDLVIFALDDGEDACPMRVHAHAARLSRVADCLMLCANSGNVAVLSAAVAGGANECLVGPIDGDLLRFKLEQTGVLPA